MGNETVKVERVLVQGNAEFRISCNELMALVTKEQAANDEYMEEWLRDKAYKILASGHSCDSEAEYSNEIPVVVSQEIADKYTGKIITNSEWREIREESRQNVIE